MEPTIGSERRIFGEEKIAPNYKEVICFIESLKMKLGLGHKYSLNAVMKLIASGVRFTISL